MKTLLLLTLAGSLAACISFPRAERQRREAAIMEMNAPEGANAEAETGPPVPSRASFRDHYFR